MEDEEPPPPNSTRYPRYVAAKYDRGEDYFLPDTVENIIEQKIL